jgi:hypothetical protein
LEERAEATRLAIAHSTGTTGWHKACGINLELLCTDGVMAVAEVAQAHWLIDIVGSLKYDEKVLKNMVDMANEGRLIVCELTVDEKKKGLFTATAMDIEEPLYEQQLEYTDFPLESFKMWLDMYSHKGNWVLYLPSEH